MYRSGGDGVGWAAADVRLGGPMSGLGSAFAGGSVRANVAEDGGINAGAGAADGVAAEISGFGGSTGL